MDINVFENAKFGQLFKTKNNVDLVFIGSYNQYCGFVIDWYLLRDKNDNKYFYLKDGSRITFMDGDDICEDNEYGNADGFCVESKWWFIS